MANEYRRAMIEAASKFAAEKISEEKRSVVRGKIEATRDACEFLIRNGGSVTITGVISWISQNAPAYMISQQAFYNKGPDRQHAIYRQVFDKYADIGRGIIAKVPRNVLEDDLDEVFGSVTNLITNEEIATIGDQQLRYKIRLLIERSAAIQKQNGRLRNIGNFARIGLDGAVEARPVGQTASITDEEKDAIKELLENSDKRNSVVSFDEDGAMVVDIPASPKRTKRTVTGPYLKNALEKIVGNEQKQGAIRI